MYAVEAVSVEKRFERETALQRIGFKLKKGDFLVLLGPNGAGKSTLLKIIAGLYRPSKGDVSVLGYNLSENRDRARYLISFLGENYALYDNLTVRANLEFFGRLYDIPSIEIRSRTNELLRRFDAMQYIDRKVGELSRGTKQKVAVCRALMSKPKLLLLDEPSAFLDPIAASTIHKELNALSRSGVTIIYATQRLDELYKIGNKTLLLRKGKGVAFGSVDSIIRGLSDIEVEIIAARAVSEGILNRLSKSMRVRYGDSRRALIVSVKGTSQIPKILKIVISCNVEVISVLYLKESIDRILQSG